MKQKKMNVAELFAGVGGFRYGLEKSSKSFFNTVYANQWEPTTKKQHAFECYEKHFKNKSFNDNLDIALVNEKLKNNSDYIKEKIDLVVGGFPCQDYSVASSKTKGIEGKKGVLWWEIEKFIKHKNPNYLLLENVDRLLISPSYQRGRDFLIMLKILDELGYNVEWRIITASEYGFVQRRKRIFIFGFKRKSKLAKFYNSELHQANNTILRRKLPITLEKDVLEYDIRKKNIISISNSETFKFKKYGQLLDGKINTANFFSDYNGKRTSLNEILLKENEIKKFKPSLYLTKKQREKIFKLKNGGRKVRTTKEGFTYYYNEGKMRLYDNEENRPARTMLTSETSVNRSTHIILQNKKYRFLHPIEAEKISDFPPNWTKSIIGKKRYFVMGNALVTGVVKLIGDNIVYYYKK